MKKTLLIFVSLLFCAITFAQNVPQGINYQAVARDASGAELSNQAISVQLSVLAGTTGSVSWQETHSVTTNDFGLFSVVIGQGTSTGSGSSATFDVVDWGSASHYIKVELDAGSGLVDMGTTELMSTPYALATAGVNPQEIANNTAAAASNAAAASTNAGDIAANTAADASQAAADAAAIAAAEASANAYSDGLAVNSDAAGSAAAAQAAAATDATTKANQAQGAAIVAAAIDATTKANNAETAAVSAANAYSDGLAGNYDAAGSAAADQDDEEANAACVSYTSPAPGE